MNYLGNVHNFYISSIYDIYLVIRVDIYVDTLYEKGYQPNLLDLRQELELPQWIQLSTLAR